MEAEEKCKGLIFITWNSICDLLLIGITHPQYCSGDFPLKIYLLNHHIKHIVKLPVVINKEFRLIILDDASVASYDFLQYSLLG